MLICDSNVLEMAMNHIWACECNAIQPSMDNNGGMEMRKFKIALLVLASVTIVVWLCAMANIGLTKADGPPGATVPEGTTLSEGPIAEDPSTQSETSNVDLYRAWLEERGITGVEEDTADDAAIMVCEAFDAGVDINAMLDVYEANGFTVSEGAAIIVGAVHIYCPTHNATIDAYINDTPTIEA